MVQAGKNRDRGIMVGNRVGLVGAGFIAATHLEAIQSIKSLRLGAVIDPNLATAERLARQGGGVPAFARLADALSAKAIDRVHILVPPNLHAAVTSEALMAGLPTLVEKPIGVSVAEAEQLIALAEAQHIPLGVNQNLAFHPAFLKFYTDLMAGKYGRLRFVSVAAAVPLRQLQAKQFGHWMFERPTNIILEQMVHPLSQIVRLIGEADVTVATSKPPLEVAPGLHFHTQFDVTLKGKICNAQLHMAFGENYPLWQLTALCDDGAVAIDMVKGTSVHYRRTPYLDQGDMALVAMRAGIDLIGQGLGGFGHYLAAQLKLAGRADSFFRGLKASVAAFHEAVDRGVSPPIDARFGGHLVNICTEIARLAHVSDQPAPAPRSLLAADAPVPQYDVAVFGGTGFIGKKLVEQLVADGYSVGVIARGVRGLPEIFNHPKVSLLRGDVTRAADIERGIGAAHYVINLAHGGASGSRQHIVDVMTGSARHMAETCLAHGVKRLVHVSTIAALYLGDAQAVITPATPPDPRGAERGDYSFAKAEAERLLLDLHRQKGLPVTIQRPGVVVGEGASPFHSGLGLFNNDQHCMGWNAGRNPLPFVLVEDVASAIIASLKVGDQVHGRSDNIVGLVPMSAIDYLEELRQIIGRPLHFHPQYVWWQQQAELIKWGIKYAGGKRAPLPSAHDLRSRGMTARFDISETMRLLNWQPNGDRQTFIEKGIVQPGRALLD